MKHKLKENSTILWHKEFRPYLYPENLEVYARGNYCTLKFVKLLSLYQRIKGKQTNKKNLGAKRANEVLEIIHTYICGPFLMDSWNKQRYFIFFIDDQYLFNL